LLILDQRETNYRRANFKTEKLTRDNPPEFIVLHRSRLLVSTKNRILTASGARYELTGLVKKSLDVTLAALPMLHGQAPDVANKAKGGEGGVEKQGEQATTVS